MIHIRKISENIIQDDKLENKNFLLILEYFNFWKFHFLYISYCRSQKKKKNEFDLSNNEDAFGNFTSSCKEN